MTVGRWDGNVQMERTCAVQLWASGELRVLRSIQQHLLQETRVTGYQLKDVALPAIGHGIDFDVSVIVFGVCCKER